VQITEKYGGFWATACLVGFSESYFGEAKQTAEAGNK